MKNIKRFDECGRNKNANLSQNFALFSTSKIKEVEEAWIPKPDSVVLEDIASSINNEAEINQQYDNLGIVKLNGQFINPIQRKAIFQMPRKPARVPVTLYKQYLDSLHCLCRTFGYENLKTRLFNIIDSSFAIVIQEFQYRMTKSLIKQVEIDLLQSLAQNQKQAPLIKDDFFSEIQRNLCQFSETTFKQQVKGEFLNLNAMQQRLNITLELVQRAQLQFADLSYELGFVVQDAEMAVAKHRLLNLGDESFRYSFDQVVKLANNVYYSMNEAHNLQQKIQNRRNKIDECAGECAAIRLVIQELLEQSSDDGI